MIAAFAGVMYNNKQEIDGDAACAMLRNMPLPSNMTFRTGAKNRIVMAIATNDCQNIEVTDDKSNIFVASGSIYNKDEFYDTGICESINSDFSLIRNVWINNGAKAVTMLNGDWMFAAYDEEEDKLLIARSWGYSSLYIYKTDDIFAFATHPKAFEALGIKLTPNVNSIAKILCTIALDGDETCIENIRQLPPATYLQISSGIIEEHTFWRPKVKLSYENIDEKDAYSMFVEKFDAAVKKRIVNQKEVGATLSAGLDSSCVCAFAARELKLKDKKLITYTSVPQYNSNPFPYCFGDESEMAKITADYIGNTSLELMQCANVSPIQAIRSAVLYTFKPLYNATNFFWIENILSKANMDGCTLILNGQLGNGTVSWSPFKTPLVPKSKFFPRTGRKRYLQIALNRIKYNIIEFFGAFMMMSNKKQSYVLKSKSLTSKICKGNSNRKISRIQALDDHLSLFDIWYHYSLQNGVEVSDPTMDKELIEFLLSLPENIYYRDELDRRLLRLSMKDILPDKIRFNRKRGLQASDIVSRIEQFSSEAESAILEIENCPRAAQLLDTSRMRKVLLRIKNKETGEKIFRDCNVVLLRGIAAGFFLQAFDN